MEPRQEKKATVIILEQLESALVAYKKDCGKFPTQSEGLKALVEPNGSCQGKSMHWPYFKKFPVDGSGKAFEYLNDGKKIRVGTNEDQIKAGHNLYFECEIESSQCKNSF